MAYNSVNDVANTAQEMDRLRLNDGEFVDVHGERNPPARAGNFDYNPKHPEYSSRAARQISFYGWDSIHMSPNDLVAAGFYYTATGQRERLKLFDSGMRLTSGIQDYVLCFVCGGGVKGWENEDSAWGEHARWYPDCPFVKQFQATPQASVEDLALLFEENVQLRDQRLCKVCLDREICVLFLPCRHLACCNICADELNSCAICRSVINEKIRVYTC